MAAAYVFIQIGPVAPRDAVLDSLRGVQGVKQAHALMGRTDAIGFVEGDTQEELVEIIERVRAVAGVTITHTRYAEA